MSTPTETDMGTIYILSLPSFTWTKTAATTAWRYVNHCRIIGQSQMLNIGGIQYNFTEADTFPSGLGIFDLNTQTWTTSYDPNSDAYSPPSSISGLYNSDGSPKSDVDFSDTALKTIFSKATTTSSTESSTQSSPTSTTSNSSTTSSTSSPAKAKKVATGPIVGGVLGGIAIVSVAGIVAFFCLRRRRRGPDYKKPNAPPSEMQGSGAGYYAHTQHGPTSEMGSGNMNHPAEMSTPNSGQATLNSSNGYGSPGTNNPGAYYLPVNGYDQQHHAGGMMGADGQVYQFPSQSPKPDTKPPVGMQQTHQVHELS